MGSRSGRHLSMFVVAGLFVAMQHTSVAGQPEHEDDSATVPVTSRVRTGDPKLAALIQQARDGSPTFRGIVIGIQSTDGLVYVDRGRCRQGIPACLTWVAFAGGTRILHVVVADRKSDIVTMASIGHELRHALEVLSDSTIKSRAAMHYFYEREGIVRNLVFETRAATAAGEAVRSELLKR